MKQLLIIGASGFGRGTFDMAKHAVGYGTEFQLKGFLDINLHALDEYPMYPKVISSEDEYQIQPDDVFICALGDVALKRKVIDKMTKRGAQFYSLIHEKAIVSPSAVVGEGTIIQPFVIVDAGVKVGGHCLLQAMSILGHDVSIGDYTRIDCQVMCVGGVQVGSGVTLHTSSVLNHKVVVEDNATVGACSFVIRKVKEGTLVAGNPAKRLEL